MIATLSLEGFKSFISKQRVDMPPLCLLSGANSSGKSSLMQPILLLKQTLESPYDPGPLLLDGPNLRITSAAQILSRSNGRIAPSFSVGIGTRSHARAVLTYRRDQRGSLRIESQTLESDRWGAPLVLSEGKRIEYRDPAFEQIEKEFPAVHGFVSVFRNTYSDLALEPVRDRSFLSIQFRAKRPGVDNADPMIAMPVLEAVPENIKSLIHLPGLRGKTERNYRATAVEDKFPGTFEAYVASIIWRWQESGAQAMNLLGEQLQLLGLTTRVRARKIQDTEVELKVSRLPGKKRVGAPDYVSIADVGLGVGQILPVLVALLVAKKGQTVYVEQPELHLHPRAQLLLAEVVVQSVLRGVQVIAETHSALLIRGVQTLVARGRLKGSSVGLNWFSRNPQTGATSVSSTTLDAAGAFGDWPSDFDEVAMLADEKYLDAATEKLPSASGS